MAEPAGVAPRVTTERRGDGVAVIRMDHAARHNALSLALKAELSRQVALLAADASVRAVVLTGTEAVFAAGTDIREMAEMGPLEHTLQATDRVFGAVRRCPQPVVAAVRGLALGGGCELALSCDLVVAGESAELGQPEIRLGIIPGAGGTVRWVRAAGYPRAMRFLLTGDRVAAREALAMGLVSEVVPDAAVLERAVLLASRIAALPPLAARLLKEVARAAPEAPAEVGLALERKTFQLLFGSEDQKEGMRAFLEGRPPVWRGR